LKKKGSERPERRRALAEINLIGQKGVKVKPKRRGCVPMFGLISILGATIGLFAIQLMLH